jgi:hemophore-related protein
MFLSAYYARFAVAAAFSVGAMVCGTVPSALADPPPPGCSAADLEQATAGVSADTAGYLFTHPDVNAFFSSLKGQPKDQVRTQIQNYLNNNPQTKSDLAGIRQPLHDLKNRCQ